MYSQERKHIAKDMIEKYFSGQLTEAGVAVNKLYQRRQRTTDETVYQISSRDLDLVFEHINTLGEIIEHTTESHNVLENKMLALEKQRDWLAEKLAWACEHHGGDELNCGIPDPCPYSKGLCRCIDTEKAEWLQVAKEAVGELK